MRTIHVQGFFKERANGGKGPKIYQLYGMSNVDYNDCVLIEITDKDIELIKEMMP